MSLGALIGFLRVAARQIFRATDAAGVRVYAASIAYHAIVVIVSFLTVGLFLWDRLGGDDVPAMFERLPGNVTDIAQTQALRLEDAQQQAVLITGLVAIGFGIYGLASGFAAVYDALNRIHGTYRYVPWMRKYLRAGAVALAFTSTMVLAALITAAASSIQHEVLSTIGLGFVSPLFDLLIATCASVIMVLAAFTFVLRWGSRARPPWSEVMLGAAVATIIWLLFVLGFVAVIELAGPYAEYGALASALVMLLFAYWSAYLLLCCALFAAPVIALPVVQALAIRPPIVAPGGSRLHIPHRRRRRDRADR
jgi:uncharacterized BrkB/YihY/UPF0761 family membrane protein